MLCILNRALGKYHSKVSDRLWGHLVGQHILCSREPFAETRRGGGDVRPGKPQAWLSAASLCGAVVSWLSPRRAEKLADQGRGDQGRS